MKMLKIKFYIGAVTIATTMLLAYNERGHIGFGTEFLISVCIAVWLMYEVWKFIKACHSEYREVMRYAKKAEKIIRSLKNSREDMRIALIQSHEDLLEMERENKAMMEIIKEVRKAV